MSSFRRAPGAAAPAHGVRAGVRPFVNGQALVSSGLASLDAFLGGGLLLGSVSLLEVAPAGGGATGGSAATAAAAAASRALVDDLHRYFVAEGVITGQRVVVVAEDAARFVQRELPLAQVDDSTPRPAADNGGDDGDGEKEKEKEEEKEKEKEEEDARGLAIAWQYGKYDGARRRRPAAARFCHRFDLSRPMQAALLAGAGAPVAVDPLLAAPPSARAAPGGVRAAYAALLAAVAAAVDAAAGPHQVARVCVRGLGAPALGPPTAAHMAALLWFVRRLRALAAGRRVVVQLSGAALAGAFPAAIANELRHASDCVLQLRALAGERDLLPPDLRAFRGLLELRKLPRIHALAAVAAPAARLGLKRDRRALRVERLHLGPETSRSASGPPLDPLAF